MWWYVRLWVWESRIPARPSTHAVVGRDGTTGPRPQCCLAPGESKEALQTTEGQRTEQQPRRFEEHKVSQRNSFSTSSCRFVSLASSWWSLPCGWVAGCASVVRKIRAGRRARAQCSGARNRTWCFVAVAVFRAGDKRRRNEQRSPTET